MRIRRKRTGSIETGRLILIPRSCTEMALLCAGEPDGEMKRAYRGMLEAMQQYPGREAWLTAWKIDRIGGPTIGGIGFKGAPDAEGTVEIGYGIDAPFRRNGYAAEAVAAMVQWAFAHEQVQCVTAQTEADNAASRRVLTKCGFFRCGSGEEGPLFRIGRDSTGQ